MKRRHRPKPPFTVDLVDQFEAYCEDGYGTVGRFDTLEAAIAEARRITEEDIKTAGSYQEWEGMGCAGLVYDATGKLIWNGVKVAEAEHLRESTRPGAKGKVRETCVAPTILCCMSATSRYSVLPDGRVLDSEPLKKGKGILVFENGKWVPFTGTAGEWRDSKPLTASEAAALTSAGTRSQ